jgi:rubrerythrin
VTPSELVAELDAKCDAALGALAQRASAPLEGDKEELSVADLLKLALKNELEATECAAAWLPSTPEIDVKLALARQAGDEAKHYRLIEKRLEALGVSLAGFDPMKSGKSPLLKYLLGLEGTVERVAAGQFTREALALVRNRAFIDFCKAAGDEETAKLYEEIIQPDEKHHHQLGRSLLLSLATTADAQSRARAASDKVLAIAEEVSEILRLERGARSAPGC